MSFFDSHLPACEHEADAGAYVLGALEHDEAEDFSAHLVTCATCRREVDELTVVVDHLPMTADQLAPPASLKSSIMRVVDAEAALLAAAGPDAGRVPESAQSKGRWSWLTLRPAYAAACATALLALGVVGGVLATAGDDTPTPRTIAAQVSAAAGTAHVEMRGHRASLVLDGVSSPPPGQVYQVWLVRKGGKPVASHTLFNVRGDGRAHVQVQEDVGDYDQMLVTAEPSGGSQQPTSAPVIAANI